jgi:hypothetical protein
VSRPRYVHEKVTTTIGQHQDAAPLIRAAAYASNWSGPKWIGLLCIFVGLGGWLYGVTHKETGYPLVFLKVAGCYWCLSEIILSGCLCSAYLSRSTPHRSWVSYAHCPDFAAIPQRKNKEIHVCACS